MRPAPWVSRRALRPVPARRKTALLWMVKTQACKTVEPKVSNTARTSSPTALTSKATQKDIATAKVKETATVAPVAKPTVMPAETMMA